MKQLVIIGAGGQGQDVHWAAMNIHARQPSYVFAGFCDDAEALRSGIYCGLPLLGTIEAAAAKLTGEVWFICAVGDNRNREKLVARAEQLGWQAESIVDPSVPIAPGVTIGAGSYVGALAVLSSKARIGRHVLVNQGCSIGHDSVLGDFSQVCPGCRISGAAVLGTGGFVGSNGVIAPRIEVGAWARLGANAFAMRNVPAGSTAVGNPARVVFSRQ